VNRKLIIVKGLKVCEVNTDLRPRKKTQNDGLSRYFTPIQFHALTNNKFFKFSYYSNQLFWILIHVSNTDITMNAGVAAAGISRRHC
jgi:hypothetical protein